MVRRDIALKGPLELRLSRYLNFQLDAFDLTSTNATLGAIVSAVQRLRSV